ncbi:MAG TPA: PIG-L family deacetylase [Acidimicrobiales bacterium]|nr:PIG-L family deacetylase [Acidimicrobiales bacterium]
MGRDRASDVLPVGDLLAHGAGSVDIAVPAVALAVAAHPDDVEFGCGATLAKWAGAGCRIHHLILTDGSKGTWEADDDVDSLVERRRQEQRRAAAVLAHGEAAPGAVRFLDWPDGELESGLAARRQVCEAIREVRPDVVLGHDPWRRYRLHPDHRHAGWLLTDGVVAARDPKFFPDLGPPHRPRRMLLWEADEPNHVESADGLLDVKVRALLAHRSQYHSTMGIGTDPPRGGETHPELATFRARIEEQLATHGRLAGVVAGEAFRLLTEL